jgi:hypothetical protein
MTERTKAERLAEYLTGLADDIEHTHYTDDVLLSAAELRRLSAENETLRRQHLAAHNNSAALMGALTQVSLLTDLGGEVAEYADVVEAVRRLHALNGELLEALKLALPQLIGRAERTARAAIAKAEGA